MNRRLLPGLAVFLAAACVDPSESVAPEFAEPPAASNVGVYTIIKVDQIDMGAGRAHGINDNGVAVGTTSAQSGTEVFKWTKAGGMQLTGIPGTGLDINNSGDITGRSGLHAYVAWNGGLVVDLGTLGGGNDSDGNAINNAGQVAGRSDTDAAQHAFRWTSPGGMTDVHAWFLAQPHAHSEARGINNNGYVVGAAQDGYTKDAFRWTPSGSLTILPDLGGAWTLANDINDSGVIVGQAEGTTGNLPFGYYYAVKWTSSGITVLSGGGDLMEAAHAINKNGYVVGRTDAKGPTLWRPSGSMIALGQLPGGSGAIAYDVNRHLEIVGRGLDANYVEHAVYWKVTIYNYAQSALAPWAQPASPAPWITLGASSMIEVAILSERGFDASRLDASRFTLGDWRGTDTGLARNASGAPVFARADVDKDGDIDLVLSFEQAALERNRDLTAETTELIVSADLGEGNGTYGRNAVRVRLR
jgi:probable HAF family extracellular repeat protein